MSNASRALASRITRSLRNENIIVMTGTNREYVTLTATKADLGFAIVTPHADGFTLHSWDGFAKSYGALEFASMVKDLKELPAYPAPKVREPKMVAKTHGAPKYVGLSMGSFKPEVALFHGE